MALTRSFKETIRDRAQNDPEFRVALLKEAIEQLLDGDVDAGRNILGKYVNATIGYQSLGKLMGVGPKSLMRMLGPKGNPRANNLFGIIHRLQQYEGVQFEVGARLRKPYDVYANLELKAGACPDTPKRDAKSAVNHSIRNKHST